MFESMWSPWGEQDPFAEMETFRRRFDRLFDEIGRDRRAQAAAPRTNVYDAGARYVLEVELPGFTSEEVQVTVDRNVLTLTGSKKAPAREGWSVHRRERARGAALELARSFTLPARVDAERVTAQLKDGILTIDLPKAPEAQPRQITVKAS